MLIMKTLKYKATLKSWNALPAAQKDWGTFETTFRNAQKVMRKTGELTTPDGVNYTDLLNVISEGVKQGLINASPPTNEIEMIEQANFVNGQTMIQSTTDQSQLSTQIEAMSERMNQMQQMLLAPERSPQQQMQRPQMQKSYQQPHGRNPFMVPYPQ